MSAILQRVRPYRYSFMNANDEKSLEVYSCYYVAANPDLTQYEVWKNSLPYQIDDVIFVEHKGKPYKALIKNITCKIGYLGLRYERYHVVILTKDYEWSKQIYSKSVDDIKAGYKLAGLDYALN